MSGLLNFPQPHPQSVSSKIRLKVQGQRFTQTASVLPKIPFCEGRNRRDSDGSRYVGSLLLPPVLGPVFHPPADTLNAVIPAHTSHRLGELSL